MVALCGFHSQHSKIKTRKSRRDRLRTGSNTTKLSLRERPSLELFHTLVGYGITPQHFICGRNANWAFYSHHWKAQKLPSHPLGPEAASEPDFPSVPLNPYVSMLT